MTSNSRPSWHVACVWSFHESGVPLVGGYFHKLLTTPGRADAIFRFFSAQGWIDLGARRHTSISRPAQFPARLRRQRERAESFHNGALESPSWPLRESQRIGIRRSRILAPAPFGNCREHLSPHTVSRRGSFRTFEGQYPRAADSTPLTLTERPRGRFKRSIVERFSTLT